MVKFYETVIVQVGMMVLVRFLQQVVLLYITVSFPKRASSNYWSQNCTCLLYPGNPPHTPDQLEERKENDHLKGEVGMVSFFGTIVFLSLLGVYLCCVMRGDTPGDRLRMSFSVTEQASIQNIDEYGHVTHKFIMFSAEELRMQGMGRLGADLYRNTSTLQASLAHMRRDPNITQPEITNVEHAKAFFRSKSGSFAKATPSMFKFPSGLLRRKETPV